MFLKQDTYSSYLENFGNMSDYAYIYKYIVMYLPYELIVNANG